MSWSENNISTLLEALHARESLWNSKEVVYRGKNIRKREYEEIVALLRDDMPNINLPAVRGTIFSCSRKIQKCIKENVMNEKLPR